MARERLKESMARDDATKHSASPAPMKLDREISPIQPSTLPPEDEEERVLFLRKCVAAHIQSFDFAIGRGLSLITEEIDPVLVRGPASKDGESTLIALRIHSLSVLKPRFYEGSNAAKYGATKPIFPTECRRTASTYRGELFAAFTIVLDNNETIEIPSQRIARIPIMVGSSACNLREKDRSDLVALGEEEYEVGGPFIVNGAEKVLRLIVVPRCNHAISAQRAKNASRGPLFSDLSLSYRSMRRDQSTYTLHFHLLRSGAVRARVNINKNEYFVPVGILMRALLPSGTTDRDIYEMIVGGEVEDSALCNSSLATVKELSETVSRFRKRDTESGINPAVSKSAATAYLGRNFGVVIGADDPSISSFEAGVIFLRKYILVHLSVGSYEDPSDSLDRSKADLIVLLVRKLVATSTGDVEVDDADSLSHQSVLTSGQLYLNLLKERLEALLKMFAAMIRRESMKEKVQRKASWTSLKEMISEILLKVVRADQVSLQLAYLLSTGNLRSEDGLDLPQAVGYAVIAERINYLRYISHFRAIHRGAFYASMRSTKVRKLLPEAWGFICPVHTPDGDPCGILNHLASEAIVTQGSIADRKDILDLFSDFNFAPAPALSSIHTASPQGSLPVVVDGRVLGFVAEDSAEQLVIQLRYTKVREAVRVLPKTSEVTFIRPIPSKSGFAPGIYIHTGGGRLMRPVKWLQKPSKKASKTSELDQPGSDEWIGSLEQVFLRIRPAVKDQDYCVSPVNSDGASHSEISSVAFLSVLASLSPFPDMNQGPRNMFQCQMAKQTMGTPCHTIWNRMESKFYRHTTPQVPITRNFCMQDPLGADNFPNGVNAIVAVISYTGNDMEDALILNKSSLERGFAHGTVYMNQKVNLDDSIAGRETSFRVLTDEESDAIGTVETDGLPAVGTRLKKGSKLYGTCPTLGGGSDHSTKWKEYTSVESGTVDEVTILNNTAYQSGSGPQGEGIRMANIRTRVSRPPCVGDKFASRAGQKGTMSAAWPVEDMPFSETGMVPDILFNPNGFPSRMTIGMMVEIMSGKSGALHGQFHDSTPFVFDEKHRAVDFFAEQLVKAGYDYCGSETLYSGYSGEPFKVNIFMGIVHYQRLRHMVSDKFQVRTNGAIHPLFRQPIKGRKRGGAIRFGEMERDGLLAHGASFLLRDRLALASDLHVLHVCERCRSLLSPICENNQEQLTEIDVYCKVCEKERSLVRRVALPYSFKYLANELAAMNIRTVLELREVA